MKMRLIDADALIEQTELICTRHEVRWTDNRVMAWIDNAPTVDAVPVVRCKDCVNGTLCSNLQGAGYVDCVLDDCSVRRPHDFCSYGERRSGE